VAGARAPVKEEEMAETDGDAAHRNEVLLVGRVSGEAVELEMPSGDLMVKIRVVVRRRQPRRGTSRSTVDPIDCAAWLAGPRRTLLSLEPGDLVEVTGELHRRFLKGASGISRHEVEVHRVKRLARAAQLSA
jgi:single-strand DNA-binding protein